MELITSKIKRKLQEHIEKRITEFEEENMKILLFTFSIIL